MLHLVLYVLLAIIVAVGLFLVASRFLPAGEQIAPAVRDEPVWELPAERSLRAEDIDSLRLPVALRGYRFAETDVLLDRLAGELRARDAEIARLRGTHPEPAGAASEPAGETSADDPTDQADQTDAAHTSYAPPRPRPATPAQSGIGPATDPGGDDRP